MALTDTEITCRIINGGELGERKGINVPNVAVNLPAITDKDKSDILFGIEQDVDYIAASFVRKAEDIREIKRDVYKRQEQSMGLLKPNQEKA